MEHRQFKLVVHGPRMQKNLCEQLQGWSLLTSFAQKSKEKKLLRFVFGRLMSTERFATMPAIHFQFDCFSERKLLFLS